MLSNGSANLRQADIVFLTDGVASVSDRFREQFQALQNQRQVSLLSIFVGGAQPGKSLVEISDSIWNLKDVLADEIDENL